MTIREELERMGPEVVRKAMVAFEHSPDSFRRRQHADGTLCCFLTHAFGSYHAAHRWRETRTVVETNFENWKSFPGYCGGREHLRQECIAYLAECGDAIEPTPAVVVS